MRPVLTLASILCLCAATLGPAPAIAEEDVEMVVDGTPAPEGKYPYQVRLYDSLDDEKGSCGGSIIGDRWILTAAHCLYQGRSETKRAIESSEVVVGYGSNDREQTTKIEVAAIYVHPKYAACEGETGCADAAKADIALLKLARPIANPKTVALADPASVETLLVPGSKVVVTGWGAMWDPYDEDVAKLLAAFGAGAKDKGSNLNWVP